MNWNDCAIVKPPVNTQVLAYGPGLGALVGGVEMDICVWDGDEWWVEGGTELAWGNTRWSHWTPLPSPPVSPAHPVT